MPDNILRVAPADPRDPACAALLTQSHALLGSLFASGDNHFLDIDALAAPDIRFFAATRNGAVLGTGALALRDGYAEIKSMFTDPSARGQGVADAILRHLVAAARAENRPTIRLETGPGLDAAHRLYARHGFLPRGPFGPYEESAASLFFERSA